MKIQQLSKILEELRIKKKERTAQELLNEVLENTSSPSYWKNTKNIKEGSYYNYNYQKNKLKGGTA